MPRAALTPPSVRRSLVVSEAHVAPGFVAATDMLTRASAASDFAPDASPTLSGARCGR